MLKNKTKSKSTLELDRVSAVKSDREHSMPMVLLSSLTVIVSVFCMVKIVIMSFKIFENVFVGTYIVGFTEDEQFSFFLKMFLGCGVICLVNALPKHSVKSTFALLIGFALYYSSHYKYVANGFVHVLNKALYTIQSSKGLSKDTYYLTYFEQTDVKAEIGLFLYAVIFGTCFLLAYAVIKHCSPIIFISCAVIYVSIPLVFNVFSGDWYLMVIAVCCITQFVIRIQGYSLASPNVSAFGVFGSAAVKGKRTAYSAFQQACAVLLCMSVTLGIVNTIYDFSNYERNEKVDELGKNIIDTVQTIGSGGFSSFTTTINGLTNGNISRIGNMHYTGETEFKIKCAQRLLSPMYLRGFTAADYDGKRWTQLTGKQYRNYENMWNDFNQSDFYPQFMFSYLDNILNPDRRLYDVTIQNENINKKLYLTSPQLCVNQTQSLADAHTEYDNAFVANSFSGFDRYDQTVSFSNANMESIYFESLNNSDGSETTPKEVNSIYDVLHDGNFSYTNGLSAYYYDDDTADEIEKYYEREYEYRRFVTENYLDYPENIDDCLPEDFDLTIGQFFDSSISDTFYVIPDGDGTYYYNYNAEYYYSSERGFTTEDMLDYRVIQNYYNYVCEYIKSYLWENAEYTLSPGATPYGEDFVEYFINQNHKGYCVHFATAATLMLRRAGIPARYVEGYFVGTDDISQIDSDGFADIPDSNAHSWTEVYIPILGWQVVDFTPSYGSIGEVPDENKSYLDADSSADTETETDISTDSESDTESQTDTSTDRESDTVSDLESDSEFSSDTGSDISNQSNRGDSKTIGKIKVILRYVFTVVLIILSVVLLWLMSRFIVLTVRKRKFDSPNKRAAALALYAHVLLILSFMNIKPMENEGETEFARRVSEKIVDTERLDFKKFTLSTLNARFGKSQPDNKEIADMKDFVDALADELYQSSGKCKKLIIKYIFFLH